MQQDKANNTPLHMIEVSNALLLHIIYVLGQLIDHLNTFLQNLFDFLIHIVILEPKLSTFSMSVFTLLSCSFNLMSLIYSWYKTRDRDINLNTNLVVKTKTTHYNNVSQFSLDNRELITVMGRDTQMEQNSYIGNFTHTNRGPRSQHFFNPWKLMTLEDQWPPKSFDLLNLFIPNLV